MLQRPTLALVIPRGGPGQEGSQYSGLPGERNPARPFMLRSKKSIPEKPVRPTLHGVMTAGVEFGNGAVPTMPWERKRWQSTGGLSNRGGEPGRGSSELDGRT